MSSINELNIDQFVDTGLTTPMARYTFRLGITWTDDQGVKHVVAPVTKTFPNDITAMPLSVRKAFAIKMIDATVRVALGIETWASYE